MGRKNPNNIRFPPSALDALTLREIVAAGWTVLATCRRCHVSLVVDMPAMLKVHGPAFLIWGRRPRCRVWTGYGDDNRCPGRVEFTARSIPGGQWVKLEMTSEVRLAQDFMKRAAAERANSQATQPLPSDDQSG